MTRVKKKSAPTGALYNQGNKIQKSVNFSSEVNMSILTENKNSDIRLCVILRDTNLNYPRI